MTSLRGYALHSPGGPGQRRLLPAVERMGGYTDTTVLPNTFSMISAARFSPPAGRGTQLNRMRNGEGSRRNESVGVVRDSENRNPRFVG